MELAFNWKLRLTFAASTSCSIAHLSCPPVGILRCFPLPHNHFPHYEQSLPAFVCISYSYVGYRWVAYVNCYCITRVCVPVKVHMVLEVIARLWKTTNHYCACLYACYHHICHHCFCHRSTYHHYAMSVTTMSVTTTPVTTAPVTITSVSILTVSMASSLRTCHHSSHHQFCLLSLPLEEHERMCQCWSQEQDWAGWHGRSQDWVRQAL